MLLRDHSGTLSPRSVAETTAALRDHLWHAAITLWAFSSKVTILLAKNMWCHPLGSTHEVYDLQLWVFESQLGHLRVADAFSTRDERVGTQRPRAGDRTLHGWSQVDGTTYSLR